MAARAGFNLPIEFLNSRASGGVSPWPPNRAVLYQSRHEASLTRTHENGTCGAGWPPGNLRRIANPPLAANWRAIFESGHDTASAVLWSFYISVSATVAPAVLPVRDQDICDKRYQDIRDIGWASRQLARWLR